MDNSVSGQFGKPVCAVNSSSRREAKYARGLLRRQRRRHAHQAAHTHIGQLRHGLEAGQQRIHRCSTLLRFVAHVDLQQDILYQPKRRGTALQLLRKRQTIHGMNQLNSAQTYFILFVCSCQ